MTEIFWSGSAKKNLIKTIDYLFENWTLKEVLKFQNKLKVLSENISHNNSICPKSKIYNLRKCLIDKNNSLIYLVENEVIYIVALVDNRSSHVF